MSIGSTYDNDLRHTLYSFKFPIDIDIVCFVFLRFCIFRCVNISSTYPGQFVSWLVGWSVGNTDCLWTITYGASLDHCNALVVIDFQGGVATNSYSPLVKKMVMMHMAGLDIKLCGCPGERERRSVF